MERWRMTAHQCCGAVLFWPAPAPASQDGGSGSSSSPEKKKFLKNFTSQFTGACFIQSKVQMLSFAFPVLYLKRQINFILHYWYR